MGILGEIWKRVNLKIRKKAVEVMLEFDWTITAAAIFDFVVRPPYITLHQEREGFYMFTLSD